MGAQITIIKIDIDKNPELATSYQVKGVPTMILFNSGRQVWRKSGVVPKQELIEQIRQFTFTAK
jgi:thioredoxin 1